MLRAESSQPSSSAETAPRALDFRILGSLEVWREGERLTPGRGRQSALLAMLLLNRNQAVPSERLIEELWPAEPPRTAPTALQVYIGRLRKLLGRDRVVTQGRGYALQVDPGELDADRFEQLVRVGRPAEALQLWRGPALADFPYEGFTQNEIGRLTELRVLALEQALGAEIDAGRASEAVSDLEVLVAENPYRERLRLLLMVALYRSGRQPDALDAYQEARRALVELGVEPSEELRDLQRRILAQDAGLAGPNAPTADHAVAARTERRIVTILDCRLADAARLGDQLDPEPFRDLLDQFADACSAAIKRHIGTVADGSGQLVLGAFGTVRASEDDALRALRAATEIHAALRPLELEASIGIATGEILAGGEVARVAGAVVSLAAMLQAKAEPRETVFDEDTYARCRDAIVAHAVAPRGEDRGEPVPAYALDRVIEGALPVRRHFETPLVGRESELADSRYVFDAAVQERTTTLFTILGGPGVGKTRLARELVATVAGDARVLESRCVSYGEGITYWPLRDLILAAFGAESTLARMTEALAGEPDGEATAERLASTIGLGDRPATRGEIFAATRRLVEVLAREGPLVLVFEDIHWAESTLLDLIEYLAANVRDAPVFLLCLARTELVEQRADWSGGESSGSWLRLEPLSVRESAALLGHLAPELDAGLRSRIVSAAEGNPFFLEQTLALALEGAGDVDVPPSIQAVLAERLDQLGISERAVVEAAAVIGRDFSVESVEELLSRLPDISAGRELASLARREIVRPHSSPHYADGYRFGHILVRESAYAAIPKRVRADLHERYARWLATRRYASDEVTGYHLERACSYLLELGDDEVRARELAQDATERLGAAAARAFGRSDFISCANFLSRALALPSAADAGRLELLIVYGRALWQVSRFQESRRALEDAGRLARRLRDGDAAVRAQLWLGRTRWSLEPNVDVAEVERQARAAAQRFEAVSDHAGAYDAWSVVQSAGNHRSQFASCLDALERALEHGRKAGIEGRLLGSQVMAHAYGPTTTSAGIAFGRKLLDGGGLGLADEADVLDYLGPILAMRGEFDEARSSIRRALALWFDAGVLAPDKPWLGELARVEALAGEWAEAERCLRVMCEQCETPGREPMLATYAGLLAHCLCEQDRNSEAEHWAARSAEVTPRDHLRSHALSRSARARLLARAGAAKEAEALAREAVQIAERTDWLPGIAEMWLVLGEVHRLGGRPEEAVEAVATAKTRFEQKEHVVGVGRAARTLEELGSS